MQPDTADELIAEMRGLLRLDGWANSLTHYGTEKDRTMSVYYRPSRHRSSWMWLREFWRGDDLMAAYVEKPARAMFRRGYAVRAGVVGPEIEAAIDAAKLNREAQKAYEFSRALGLGTVLLGYSDGRDLSMPVAEGARLLSAKAYDATEVHADGQHWNEDSQSPGFGEPMVWRASLINGRQLWIHPSRLLVFTGRIVSNIDRRNLRGGGESGLAIFAQHVADFDGLMRASYNGVAGLSQGVLGIKNLAQLLARNNGKELKDRLTAFMMARSMAGVMPIDAELEKYTTVTGSLAGVPEIIDRAMMRLSAATDPKMPVTELFGRSAAGMNASGDGDRISFYDECGGKQTEVLKPELLKVAQREARSRGYTGIVDIEFHPLYQPTDIEKSQLKYQQAQTDEIYVGLGADGTQLAADRGYPVAQTRTAQVKAARSTASRAALPAPEAPEHGEAAGPAGQARPGATMPEAKAAA